MVDNNTSVVKNKYLLSLLPIIFLWTMAGYIPATFMPGWSAKFFANCTSEEIANETCTYNYPLSARWNAIFGAIGGAVAFLFGAMLGDLSDYYGRVPFFYMNVILSALQFLPLIFWPNMWIKLVFTIPTGLNCSDNSLTPSMVAYIADICEKDHRMTAYGISYGIAAIGLFVGTVTAILIQSFFYTELNFVIITVINVVQIIYIHFFVKDKESLKVERAPKYDIKKLLNPLKVLCKVTAHPVVAWIGVVQFFASLPETGVLEIAISFILDAMDVNDDSQSMIVSSAFLLSAAFGLLIGNLYILPKLQELNVSDINILCIGCLLSVIAFGFMSLISFLPHLVFVVISGILLTLGMISGPVANGLVTKYLMESEQGIGFGIIFAIRAITWIVAPIFFALIYEFLSKHALEFITFLIAAGLGILELVIILCPLRKLLVMVNETGKRYSFTEEDEIDGAVGSETGKPCSNNSINTL